MITWKNIINLKEIFTEREIQGIENHEYGYIITDRETFLNDFINYYVDYNYIEDIENFNWNELINNLLKDDFLKIQYSKGRFVVLFK